MLRAIVDISARAIFFVISLPMIAELAAERGAAKAA